jgi:hypothetical protein
LKKGAEKRNEKNKVAKEKVTKIFKNIIQKA